MTQPTDHEIRIALAEAMGAKWLCHKGYRYLSFGPVRFPEHYSERDFARGDESIANKYFSEWDIPNYLTSLDACHEAEKVLTDEQYKQFGKTLMLNAKRDARTEIEEGRMVISCPARQRALALYAALKPKE